MAAPIQLKTGSNTGSNSLAVSFNSNVTAGNSIVVAIWGWASGGFDTAPSVTDSLGNTYTQVGWVGFGQDPKTMMYRAYNITGGACTVTINPSGASADIKAVTFELLAISGNGDPLDVQNGVDSRASSSTPATPSVTPTTSEWCAVAVIKVDSDASSISPESGWTQDLQVLDDTTDTAGSIVHKSGTSTAAMTHTWTLGEAHTTLGPFIAVFKTGSAGAATKAPPPYRRAPRYYTKRRAS